MFTSGGKMKPNSEPILPPTVGRWIATAATMGVLVFAVTMVGCGASATPVRGPTETLRDYAEALDQGKVDDAYAMLSDEAKREMSLEAFRRMVRENPSEMGEIAGALKRPGSAPVVTATIDTPNGDSLLLPPGQRRTERSLKPVRAGSARGGYGSRQEKKRDDQTESRGECRVSGLLREVQAHLLIRIPYRAAC